jgi:integrase
MRRMLDRLGFPWVTSHVFRKTVATRLDEAGLSAKTVADVLGHARPSMTLDVYMGRNVVSADAARILDR